MGYDNPPDFGESYRGQDIPRRGFARNDVSPCFIQIHIVSPTIPIEILATPCVLDNIRMAKTTAIVFICDKSFSNPTPLS